MNMYIISKHSLSDAQKEDARLSLGVDRFIPLPDELLNLWANIPSSIKSLGNYLQPFQYYIADNLEFGDILLIQGETGAVVSLVEFSKTLMVECYYATTERVSTKELINSKQFKEHKSKHILFRRY